MTSLALPIVIFNLLLINESIKNVDFFSFSKRMVKMKKFHIINVDGVLIFSRLIEPLSYCVLENGHGRGFQQAHPIWQNVCFFSLTSLSLDQHWFRQVPRYNADIRPSEMAWTASTRAHHLVTGRHFQIFSFFPTCLTTFSSYVKKWKKLLISWIKKYISCFQSHKLMKI